VPQPAAGVTRHMQGVPAAANRPTAEMSRPVRCVDASGASQRSSSRRAASAPARRGTLTKWYRAGQVSVKPADVAAAVNRRTTGAARVGDELFHGERLSRRDAATRRGDQGVTPSNIEAQYTSSTASTDAARPGAVSCAPPPPGAHDGSSCRRVRGARTNLKVLPN